jgi:hypothetical protein
VSGKECKVPRVQDVRATVRDVAHLTVSSDDEARAHSPLEACIAAKPCLGELMANDSIRKTARPLLRAAFALQDARSQHRCQLPANDCARGSDFADEPIFAGHLVDDAELTLARGGVLLPSQSGQV